jgi:hypothetical protein
MDTIKTIESVLENMDSSIIYKTKKTIIPALILILVGIITFSLHSVQEWPANSIISPLLITTGSIAVLLGIIKIFYRSSYFVSTQTKQRLKALDLKFNISEQNKLVRILESGNLAEMLELLKSISEALNLRVLSTDDGTLCFSQLIAYEHPEFRFITEPKQHTKEEAEILLSLK